MVPLAWAADQHNAQEEGVKSLTICSFYLPQRLLNHPGFVTWPHRFTAEIHQSEKNDMPGKSWA